MANTIADEGRIVKENQIQLKANNKIKPIWAYQMSSIKYTSAMGESSMPRGLERQEVVFL